MKKDYKLILQFKENNNNINKFNCITDSIFYNINGNKIEFCETKDFINKEFNGQILFRIRKSKINGDYEIINPVNILSEKKLENIKILENKCWWEISNKEGYILNKGDILKFGNKIYEIIELEIFNENKDININKKIGAIFDFSMTLNKNKYILEEFEKDKFIPKKLHIDNPKVNLCNCENEFIFFKDLKNKIKVFCEKKDDYITYYSENFFCEKCGVQYPYKFIINEDDKEKTFCLMDINPLNYKNYIILEYLNNKSDIKTKIIHIININDVKEKIIGRNIFCFDGKNKNKVSEVHSSLTLDKGKFLIKNISKIGTFVLIKNGFKITEKEINFKIGSFNVTANIEENKEHFYYAD